jgi:hypothetical protein
MVDCSKTNLNKWDYRSDGALVLANVSFLKSDLTFYIGDILPPNAISSDMQWDITSDGKIKSRSKGLCIGYVTCPNASACLITLTDCSNAISFTISD